MPGYPGSSLSSIATPPHSSDGGKYTPPFNSAQPLIPVATGSVQSLSVFESKPNDPQISIQNTDKDDGGNHFKPCQSREYS